MNVHCKVTSLSFFYVDCRLYSHVQCDCACDTVCKSALSLSFDSTVALTFIPETKLLLSGWSVSTTVHP